MWHPGSGQPPPRDDEPKSEPTTGEHIEQLLHTGLDRYALQRLLGVGGMGEVYLGVHRTIEKEVAIKVLAYEHRHNPQLNERFLDEAKAASKIGHPNIVDITDFGQSPQGCVYFVMEYLQGEDLSRTLRREGALPWSRAQHLVLQLLDALQAAHDHGVVHRDVKPANCVRTTRSRDPDFLKVLDFGIARISERHTGSGPERLTKEGTVMGTAEYMSPEQARGDEVDARTDLYAVGVVLFEMLTGRLPFNGRAPVEILSKHLFEAPPRASEVAAAEATITPELDELLARALAKEPDQRFASARQMAQAIEAIHVENENIPTGGMRITRGEAGPDPTLAPTMHAAGPTLASVSEPGDSPPRRRGRWIAVGAGGLLAVGAAAWWGLGGRPANAPCPEGMALIEGGSFFMGTDNEDNDVLQSGRPSHRVELGAYCIATHEVTMDQFHECSDQGRCRRPFKQSRWPDVPDEEASRRAFDSQCNESAQEHGDHPVNCVTWEQARDYCAFAGHRLPTEAEWEFAARGSDGRIYPWGDAEPTHEHGNLCNAECLAWRLEQGLEPQGTLTDMNDGWSGTAPVGSFPVGTTQHGLHDVVGNVFEWTASDFELYEGHPPGASSREGRVIRGGGHNSAYAMFSDPALRFAMDPKAHTHAIGFRCAAEPNPQ